MHGQDAIAHAVHDLAEEPIVEARLCACPIGRGLRGWPAGACSAGNLWCLGHVWGHGLSADQGQSVYPDAGLVRT
jgi:hypothetical protein